MAGNANSGRRPKPTAMKLLRGNPGKRRLNEAEPQPPAGEVTAPASLSAKAQAVWTEIAPVAIAMGTLTPADVWAFGTLCELEATRRLVSQATTLDAPHLLKLERETAMALRPYYEKFGLEPVGRSRIKVLPTEKPKSRWAGIVNG
jgi:phage terminase small subunit